MNFLEHIKLLKEELIGIFFGTVIKVESADTRRVKVRVFGIFNEPISIEHIPWAYPIMDKGVPILGDLVGIIFIEGDIQRPIYFPSGRLETIQIAKKRELYQTIINDKKGSAKNNVVVGPNTFDEPETEADNTLGYAKDVELLPEDVAVTSGEKVNQGSPAKGILIEKDMTKGKERVSVTHPSGSFIEMSSDGSIVIHTAKDMYVIINGDENSLVTGDFLKRIMGKMILDSQEIKFGHENYQPILKGDDFDTWVKSLIDKVSQLQVLTALGPQPIIPIFLTAITDKKNDLPVIYSQVSKTE